MNYVYPILKSPDKVKDFLNNPQSIEPTYPNSPTYPVDTRVESKGIFIFLTISLIILIIILINIINSTNDNKYIDIIIIIPPVLFIIFLFAVFIEKRNNQKSEYLNKIRIYHEEIGEYELNKIIYQNDLESYYNLIKMLNDPATQEKTQVEYIQKLINDETRAEFIQAKNPKLGYSELYFKEYLLKYFGDKILTDVSLGNYNISFSLGKPWMSSYYYPDFVYLDPQSGLIIDIEIDEPYSYNDLTPTHYQNADENRDEFLNTHGFFIIRFSEKQIIENPDPCCREIADLIDTIYPNMKLLNMFKGVSPINKDIQYTYNETIELIKKNYRDEYIQKNKSRLNKYSVHI